MIHHWKERVWVIVIAALLSLTACHDNNAPQSDRETPADDSLCRQSFQPATVKALTELKLGFDRGLRKFYGNRDLKYAYQQHALRMRLDVLERSPVNNVYPFNGSYQLSQNKELIADMPFITNACGYQSQEPPLTMNYYCLNLDPGFFAYLDSLGTDAPIIERFRAGYSANRSLTPQMQQDVAISAGDELDFSKKDHQLFYALFQLWMSEDLLAQIRLQDQLKDFRRD